MTPEQKAAHLARLEYMDAMGMGHMSVTDPKRIVKAYRRRVLEECAKIAEAGSLGLCNCEVNRYAEMIAAKIRGTL